MRKKQVIYIVISSVILVALLYVFDQGVMESYFQKIIIKLFLFLCIPIVYLKWYRSSYNFIKNALDLKKIDYNKIKQGVFFGVIIFILIIVVYNFSKSFIDTGVLIEEMEDKYKISKNTLVLYGLYMTIMNSFLEEYFFRGYIFLNIKQLGYKKLGHFVSSGLFALYHIANFKNWFSWPLMILALVGLFIGGVIFNSLDEKEDNFTNSWIVHMFADLAIIAIGFKIMGLY